MTVRDRMAQAAKIVLEPVFEADFLPYSFGFRPRRSAVMAMERLRTGFIAGCQFVEDWFNGHGSTGSAAPSAIRRQRNHVRKITGKPYAENRN
jgi:hypothetical protein